MHNLRSYWVLVGPDANLKQKQVSELSTEDAGINKYVLNIKVNGFDTLVHIDLGSQCSIVRITTARSLNLQIGTRPDFPVLRGIGGSLISPIGVAVCTVEVQGLKEMIDLYIVEDHVLTYPVLLGHSFTEKPDILIINTPDEIKFQRMVPRKVSF